jgi:prolipoprotein diacylglyceryl transferase
MPPLSIPSPDDPFLVHTHGLSIRWYGLLLALGVLLAGWIARREFRRRGLDPELTYSIAMWAVPMGLVGARLYHVVTDWGAFSNDLSAIPAIWQGGLGIWGAVLGGMLGTWIGTRRVGLPFWEVADCVAPGLVLAQALGRWGNYANQELYGRPSDRPWAVKIDNPPAPYEPGSTFHPTFLYESIWDLLVFFVLVWFARRWWRRVPYGTVFALYVTLYCLGRLPIETLRIDTADQILGQRLNVWTAVIFLLAGAIAFLLLIRRRGAPGTMRRAEPANDASEPPDVHGHVPTPRPETAIAARLRTQRRRRPS